MAVVGATTLFRCDRRCNASFQRITWYKNGSPLDLSSTRYGLSSGGMLLYVEKVTTTDAGEYICEGHVEGSTYQRHGSLEVFGNFSACCKQV